MKKQVEFTGKKVQDAVNEGLKTLGITMDDADIEFISSGGLFKKAKVCITYDDGLTEEEAARAAEQASPEPAESGAEVPEQPKPTEDEPHWGSAPIKREPTTNPDYGRSRRRAEKPQRKPEAAAKPTAADEHRRNNRESVLPTDGQIAAAREFLTQTLKLMGVEGEIEITVDEGMRININTEDSRVIGHRGEALDSMQQLISSVINNEHGKFVHVTVDGLGYRDRRKDTLISLANRMADKAVKTHRKVTLDAMNSADRRIVHAALGERDDVFTRSEGHEPTRRVVIIPKRR